MKTSGLLCLLWSTLCVVVACKPSNSVSPECAKIRKLFSETLVVGDGEEKIKRLMDEQHWSYTNDRSLSLYSAKITVEKKDGVTIHSIGIIVRLDRIGKVEKWQIDDVYTDR